MLPFLTQGSRFYSTYASALSKSRNKAGFLLDLLFIFPMLLDRAAFCGCQKVGLSRDITSDCRSEVTRLGGLHEFLSASKSFGCCQSPGLLLFLRFLRTCGVPTGCGMRAFPSFLAYYYLLIKKQIQNRVRYAQTTNS